MSHNTSIPTEGSNFIFLGNTPKDQLLNNVSPESKYIINMNDFLQSQDREQRDKLSRLESDYEKLEEEQDNLERKLSYTKNLVKNFHEMNKWEEEIANHYKTMFVDIKKDIKTFREQYWKYSGRYMLPYFLFQVFIWYYLWRSIIQTTLFTCSLVICSLIVHEHFNSIKVKDFSSHVNRINEIEKEMKKTEASQDYIHEYIDNI